MYSRMRKAGQKQGFSLQAARNQQPKYRKVLSRYATLKSLKSYQHVLVVSSLSQSNPGTHALNICAFFYLVSNFCTFIIIVKKMCKGRQTVWFSLLILPHSTKFKKHCLMNSTLKMSFLTILKGYVW